MLMFSLRGENFFDDCEKEVKSTCNKHLHLELVCWIFGFKKLFRKSKVLWACKKILFIQTFVKFRRESAVGTAGAS